MKKRNQIKYSIAEDSLYKDTRKYSRNQSSSYACDSRLSNNPRTRKNQSKEGHQYHGFSKRISTEPDEVYQNITNKQQQQLQMWQSEHELNTYNNIAKPRMSYVKAQFKNRKNQLYPRITDSIFAYYSGCSRQGNVHRSQQQMRPDSQDKDKSMKKLSLVPEKHIPKNIESLYKILQKKYFSNRHKTEKSAEKHRMNETSGFNKLQCTSPVIQLNSTNSILSAQASNTETLKNAPHNNNSFAHNPRGSIGHSLSKSPYKLNRTTNHRNRTEKEEQLIERNNSTLQQQQRERLSHSPSPKVISASQKNAETQETKIKVSVETVPNKYGLSEKEEETFGDRFPQKFHKVKLIGRGGFSLVWLGIHKKSREAFAIKQILTKNGHQTHMKQIWFGSFFFQGGQPREQLSLHPGINNLVKMVAYDIQHKDTWIFYELCDHTLGSALYDLRMQTNSESGDKLYLIRYQQFYESMIENPKHLKHIILEISKALALLADHKIVHSDIKTENILLKFVGNHTQLEAGNFQLKLIDYGSSFLFSNLKQFSMATPEYMAPEILNFILHQNQMPHDTSMLNIIKNYENESAIDMWSLGCVILQIVHGYPIWMNAKSLIVRKGVKHGSGTPRTGLFAVKDRNFQEIINRQIETANNIDAILATKVTHIPDS